MARLRFAFAAAVAACAAACVPGAAVAAAGGSLPAGAGFPESIAVTADGSHYFVSSFATGAVYRGRVGGPGRVFLGAGADGRASASGVKLDRHGRLYVVTARQLQVFSVRTGRLLGRFSAGLAADTSLNDLAVLPSGAVVVTDFARPRLWTLSGVAITRGTGRFSALLSAPPSVAPNLPNGDFNGIAASSDGRELIVGQTGDGALYRVDLRSRSIRRVAVDGPDLSGSDGLLLHGQTLDVATHTSGVIELQLTRSLLSATATWEYSDPTFDLPTSVALAGNRLLVSNGARPASATGYAITSLPAPFAERVVAGGCRVLANVTITPGLRFVTEPFSYAYTGRLSRCTYTGTGAASGGTISAGVPIRIGAALYREPQPTATGTCASSAASGYDFARWDNGTQTIVRFTTTSDPSGDHLTGAVVASLRLAAVDPSAGRPASAVFRTTNFLGQSVVGVIQFHVADAGPCATAGGLRHATITGVLGHVGLQP